MANYYTPEENVSWHNSLPAKHCSASIICWNENGQVLFVMSNKDNFWTFPGGVVEQYESPLDGAIRELKEEVGVELRPENLSFIGVDYSGKFKEYNDFLHFYFSAGVLSAKSLNDLGRAAEQSHAVKFLSYGDLSMHVPPYRLRAFQSVFEHAQDKGMYIEMDFATESFRDIE